MTPTALALLLTAACLHVAWNVILKRSTNRDTVTWWVLSAGAAMFLPLLAVRPLDATTWRLATLSAGVELVYFLLLAAAYQRVDLSVVYPMARGAAPVLLALWTTLLLEEPPGTLGATGIGLVGLGLFIIGGSGKEAGSGAAWAAGLAVSTSLYSLIDGLAVRNANPAAYAVAIQGLTALLLGPVILARHGPMAALRVLRTEAGPVAAAGALTILSYLLVLKAYATTPLAYAAAVREVSVVLAAIAGWLWLKEPFGKRRVLGSCIVLLGIALLGWRG